MPRQNELELIEVPGRPAAKSGPFYELDQILLKFQTARRSAAEALKPLGWKLRPNHEDTKVWRASRRAKGETVYLSASTADELIAKATEEAAPRLKLKADRKAAAELKREAKAKHAAERAAKKAAK